MAGAGCVERRMAKILITGGDNEPVVDIDDVGRLAFFALGDELDAFHLEIVDGFVERGGGGEFGRAGRK